MQRVVHDVLVLDLPKFYHVEEVDFNHIGGDDGITELTITDLYMDKTDSLAELTGSNNNDGGDDGDGG